MKAIVNSPICPLMTSPRHNCELADEALFGMVLEVLEETNDTFWRVRTPYRYEGYAPVKCLIPGDNMTAWWEAQPKQVILHKNTVDVMAEPKVQSWPLVTLTMGALVSPVEKVCKDDGSDSGWVKVALPEGSNGFVRGSWLDTYYDSPADLPEGELRQRIVDTALLYARTSYRWGGKTPQGIDCSGLVSMAYLLNGIVIYRDAGIVEGFPVEAVDRGAIKPADLLFFPGHVALYMGEGRYLHATGYHLNDGFAVNSLIPGDPLYREDLDKTMTACGRYTGFKP